MYRTYRVLYRLGITPWDSAGQADAHVAQAVPGPAGRAVDLGCGTGRQALALAESGWSVTAVDFVPAAIDAARRRDPDATVTWRVADVTRLATVDPDGRLAGTIDLVLDNGCLHGIATRLRPWWLATVNALAAPGADLLIRAVGRAGRYRGIGPAGIDAAELAHLLGDGWLGQPAPGPGWHHYRITNGHGPPGWTG